MRFMFITLTVVNAFANPAHALEKCDNDTIPQLEERLKCLERNIDALQGAIDGLNASHIVHIGDHVTIVGEEPNMMRQICLTANGEGPPLLSRCSSDLLQRFNLQLHP